MRGVMVNTALIHLQGLLFLLIGLMILSNRLLKN
jgi:hypothetical protein